ncbi:MAG: DUF6838 family protein [Candidatus Fimivivens sp.]
MDVLNDILDTLSVGIRSVIPGVPIYVEEVLEKVPERYFFIGFAGGVTSAVSPFGGRSISGTLDISYIAPPRGGLQRRKEINSIYNLLITGLTDINGAKLRLQLSNHRRTDDGADGVLHDLCSCKVFIRPVDDTPKIGSVSIDKEELK